MLGLLWHCLCILEGHLSTNLMLSALHLQGSKSNMCVCVRVRVLPLNKETIDWDFIREVKSSIKHVINLEVENITEPSLALGT